MDSSLLEDVSKNLSDSQKINLKLIQHLASYNTALNNAQNDIRELQNNQLAIQKLLITGNGVPSLVERIRNLESFVDSQKYWLRFVAGALIVQVIAFIVVAATFIIRFAPLLEQINQQLP